MSIRSRDLFRYDPDIGHTFIPDLQTRIMHESGGYLLRTNQLGFRSDRTPELMPVGGKRVFVFGDSFTAGDGVSNGKRFSDILEELISGVTFYNFGLPGSGTDQQFIAFKKFAGDLVCDLVIVVILVENIRRVASRFRPVQSDDGQMRLLAKPYFELTGGELVRHHMPVPEGPVSPEEIDRQQGGVDRSGRYPWLRQLASSLGLKGIVQKITRYQPVPEYNSRFSREWLLMRAILLAWREASCSPLLIVPLPLYQHVEETANARAYQQRFHEFSVETGVTVHDVLPDLLRYGVGERRQFRFSKDVHLTPAGHRAVALSLAPAIAAQLSRLEPKRAMEST